MCPWILSQGEGCFLKTLTEEGESPFIKGDVGQLASGPQSLCSAPWRGFALLAWEVQSRRRNSWEPEVWSWVTHQHWGGRPAAGVTCSMQLTQHIHWVCFLADFVFWKAQSMCFSQEWKCSSSLIFVIAAVCVGSNFSGFFISQRIQDIGNLWSIWKGLDTLSSFPLQVRSGSPSMWKAPECRVRQPCRCGRGRSQESPVRTVSVCSAVLPHQRRCCLTRVR